MSKFKDLTGQVFSQLTVIKKDGYIYNKNRKMIAWLCICDCGKYSRVRGNYLCNGTTKSCGCRKRDVVLERNTTHNLSHLPEYGVWNHMMQRCNNPKCEHYFNYGGRGVTVCDRWKNSFELFLEDMGSRPSPKHTIEREDNELGYFKENCVWATRQTQQYNRRNTVKIEYKGQLRTILEISEMTGMSLKKISSHHERGHSVEYMLTSKIGTNQYNATVYTKPRKNNHKKKRA